MPIFLLEIKHTHLGIPLVLWEIPHYWHAVYYINEAHFVLVPVQHFPSVLLSLLTSKLTVVSKTIAAGDAASSNVALSTTCCIGSAVHLRLLVFVPFQSVCLLNPMLFILFCWRF